MAALASLEYERARPFMAGWETALGWARFL
jgi:hypothetical protein